jgi:hypothetical protein
MTTPTPAPCSYVISYTDGTWFRCNESGILRSNTPIRRLDQIHRLGHRGRLTLIRHFYTGAALYRIEPARRGSARQKQEATA